MIYPKNALLLDNQILDFIPQRYPMIMIDAFYGDINESSYSSILIKPDNIFVENGFFSETGIMEFMAQTGIVQFNYLHRLSDDYNTRKTSKHLISKIKKFEIAGLPAIGERLYAKVDKEFNSTNLTTLSITAYTINNIKVKGYYDVISIQ